MIMQEVALSSQMIEENAVTWLAVDKWKLSVYEKERLSIVKEFPTVYISIYELELLLKADIYGVVSRFMGKMYEDGVLEDYSLIKLTGQSCKIDLFREALKDHADSLPETKYSKRDDFTEYGGLNAEAVS